MKGFGIGLAHRLAFFFFSLLAVTLLLQKWLVWSWDPKLMHFRGKGRPGMFSLHQFSLSLSLRSVWFVYINSVSYVTLWNLVFLTISDLVWEYETGRVSLCCLHIFRQQFVFVLSLLTSMVHYHFIICPLFIPGLSWCMDMEPRKWKMVEKSKEQLVSSLFTLLSSSISLHIFVILQKYLLQFMIQTQP